MKKELNIAILCLIVLSMFVQAFDLGHYYIYRTMLVLYSITCLYLIWVFFKEANKGSGMLNTFSLIFTCVLIAVQVMSITVDLSGVEYVLLSVFFTGISLGLLFLNRILKD